MSKILVAEDDLLSRELVTELLEDWGYEVVEACDGREALQQIKETSPDLVLLDIQMPILNGFAVVSQLRQDARFAALRVVAVTAYAMQGDREKGLSAGFDAYITKPIDPENLKTQIEQLLAQETKRPA